jgi:hypothetical protein
MDLTQQNIGPLQTNLSPTQQQMGLPKSILGYLNNIGLQEQFWAQPYNE